MPHAEGPMHVGGILCDGWEIKEVEVQLSFWCCLYMLLFTSFGGVFEQTDCEDINQYRYDKPTEKFHTLLALLSPSVRK